MTDKQVFEHFMSWMGMCVKEEKTLPNGCVVFNYEDHNEDNILFTTQGYDEFYAGAIFDPKGNLIKGYLDSHVSCVSKHSEEIDDLFRQK